MQHTYIDINSLFSHKRFLLVATAINALHIVLAKLHATAGTLAQSIAQILLQTINAKHMETLGDHGVLLAVRAHAARQLLSIVGDRVSGITAACYAGYGARRRQSTSQRRLISNISSSQFKCKQKTNIF